MDAMEFAASRRSVTTPYGSIAYVERGEGPAAVFVHGFLMNGYLWRDVIELLSASRRCIALDLLAHGHTQVAPGQDLSFDAQAGMIESVIDALGLRQIDLIGNDSGGGIAQIFAANHPERLRTLALTNCDTHDNWPPAALSSLVELIKSGEHLNAFRSLLANPESGRQAFAVGFEHPERLSEQTLEAYLAPLVANEESARSIERFAETFDHNQTVRIEPRLRKLDIPTLIMWGTSDIFFDKKWAYWLQRTIPGALDVIEVPNAKLFFPAERPEFFSEQVGAFWAGFDSSSG
jgi:pimeloyl-ACP methyl ester carboxylesterase